MSANEHVGLAQVAALAELFEGGPCAEDALHGLMAGEPHPGLAVLADLYGCDIPEPDLSAAPRP